MAMGKPSAKLVKLVKVLSRLNQRKLTDIIDHLDSASQNLLTEIIHNLSYNTLHLKVGKMKSIRNKMRKNKNDVLALIGSGVKRGERTKLLKRQSGSGLVTVALSVSSLNTDFLSSTIFQDAGIVLNPFPGYSTIDNICNNWMTT